MADQPGRYHRHPFSLWFQPWSSKSRVSQRSQRQPEAKPPSTTFKLKDRQSQTQSSLAARETTGKQLGSDPTPKPPSSIPSARDELQELTNGGEVEAQLSETTEEITPQTEEKPSQAYIEKDPKPLQNIAGKLEEGEYVLTRQSDNDQSCSAEVKEECKKAETEDEERHLSELKAIHPQFLRSEAQPEQNKKPEAEEDKVNPDKNSATEESSSKEEEPKRVEVAEENKELAKITEPNPSIVVSDSEPKPTRHVTSVKERRITISTKPRALAANLGQASGHNELKDGLSKLVQKLSIGHQNKHGNHMGVNIITLASENKGASMIINRCIQKGKNEEKEAHIYDERSLNQSSIATSINSNVQGINSSILDETNYREQSPGVHLTIFTKPTATPSKMGKIESAAVQKIASSSAPPQKVTYDPGIRRRCLRGLLLESSEDESFQKPRRHGCRFSCNDKNKEQNKKEFF